MIQKTGLNNIHNNINCSSFLQEPLLVALAFVVLFACVVVYVRLDLTLSRDDQAEAKMRVSSHCELVHAAHDARAR